MQQASNYATHNWLVSLADACKEQYFRNQQTYTKIFVDCCAIRLQKKVNYINSKWFILNSVANCECVDKTQK